MADPNIQTLVFPVNTGTPGVIKTYTAEVNKKTGAMVVYDTTNAFQKDPVIRNEFTTGTVDPEKKWRSEYYWNAEVRENYLKLSREERLFLSQVVEPQAINQRASFINKNYTQNQKNNLFPNMPRVQNTASPVQTSQTQQGSEPIPFDFEISPAVAGPAPDGDNLIYPIDMSGDQDRITFTAVTYEAPGANRTGTINRTDRIKTNLGRVILPVQSSITDNNSVDWQGSSLNEIERRAAEASLKLQTVGAKGLTGVMEEAFRDAFNAIEKNEGVIRVAFAGAAVGIQNLLGRYGAVLNPNLELLFSGPQLRPFNFTFKLSPRTKEESLRVRTIINFFKKNMAAKRTVDNIFLRSPNTFFIKYEGVGSNGLNKIKECALTNCSVDYTPLGTYMTYWDGTMVSYTLSLQFQEIEPIYNSDYTGNPNIIEY